MIQLTSLGGKTLFVNADLIATVEATPDTVVTLTTGRKLVVAESTGELVRLVVDYKRTLLLPVRTDGEVG